MKHLFSISLMLLLCSCMASKSKKYTSFKMEPKPYELPLDKSKPLTMEHIKQTFKINDDKHKNHVFLTPLRDSNRKKGFQPYIAVNKKAPKTPIIRLRWVYDADTWLFMSNASMICDGPSKWKKVVNFPKFGVNREVVYGGIYESYDMHDQQGLWKKISKCQNLSLRLNGKQYYSDQSLKRSEQTSFFDQLDEIDYLANQIRRRGINSVMNDLSDMKLAGK
jgi:hypothetical protein